MALRPVALHPLIRHPQHTRGRGALTARGASRRGGPDEKKSQHGYRSPRKSINAEFGQHGNRSTRKPVNADIGQHGNRSTRKSVNTEIGQRGNRSTRTRLAVHTAANMSNDGRDELPLQWDGLGNGPGTASVLKMSAAHPMYEAHCHGTHILEALADVLNGGNQIAHAQILRHRSDIICPPILYGFLKQHNISRTLSHAETLRDRPPQRQHLPGDAR